MTNTLPWSECPLVPGTQTGPYQLRPYGLLGRDLRVDFGAAQPRLVTELLCACVTTRGGQPLGEETAWELSIGRRTLVLLELLAVTTGLAHEFQHGCDQCAENFEVKVDGQDLLGLQQQGENKGLTSITAPAKQGFPALRLRRPTGFDQRDWLDQS